MQHLFGRPVRGARPPRLQLAIDHLAPSERAHQLSANRDF